MSYLTSNHRSKSAASTKPNHKWKIEVDEIKVELECQNSSGTQPNKAILKLSFKLENTNNWTLLRGTGVESIVEIRFSEERNIGLWPKNLTGVLIKKNQSGGSLNVNYYRLKAEQGQGGSGARRGSTVLKNDSLEENKFVCNFVGANKNGGERELYRKGYLRGREHLMIEEQEKDWKVQVGVQRCSLDENPKQATCNLKVTNRG